MKAGEEFFVAEVTTRKGCLKKTVQAEAHGFIIQLALDSKIKNNCYL